MSENQPPHSPDGHAHETSDAQARPLFRFAGLLAIFVAAAMLVMGILFSYFQQRETRLDTSRSPLAPETLAQPPEPRLQPNPPVDLDRLRAEWDARLQSFGWVNEKTGIVHIPIDRAIDLIAEQGLPARDEGSESAE